MKRERPSRIHPKSNVGTLVIILIVLGIILIALGLVA